MEIASRYLSNDALGTLHVVTFMPEDPVAGERNVVFNSFSGRSTTPDGFALPYELAAATGFPTDYVERPGTGLSSLPVESSLRKEYKRFGFTAVSGAVGEMLLEDPAYAAAGHIHAAGFSLGGSAAAEFTETLQARAASAVMIDGPGFCSVSRITGSARFFAYKGLEMAANKLGAKPEVGDVFESYGQELAIYKNTFNLPEPPAHSREETFMELSEVTRPTGGAALRSLVRVMTAAAEAGRPFELRAGFTLCRIMTDSRSIRDTNKAMEKFDAAMDGQQTVGYGFLQSGLMGAWHDISPNGQAVRDVATLPLALMRRRLRII